jgi:predicted nucleic acid-binding protein
MYLDSAILVKLVVREPDSEFYVNLLDGQPSVHTSELAITECRSALIRKREIGDIDAQTCARAWTRLQAYWADSGGLLLLPVTRSVLRQAGDVIDRCSLSVPIRALDAIHIASCWVSHDYPLVTNDRVMRRATEHLGIPLSRLPSSGHE